MTSRRRSVRPCLEPLDARALPAAANLTATFAGGTLTILGDNNNNDVTVKGDNASQTHFTLTSTGTINGQPSPFSTPAGVKNLVFKMLAGDDTITFDNTVAIHVLGNVSVDGGDGANAVSATDLTVAKNLSIKNGTATASSNDTYFTNLSVGGNMTIKSAGGDTFTNIERSSIGVSTIKGNLTVTNGAGSDDFLMKDMNVGKNVAINNGHGSAGGTAGTVEFYSNANTLFRSVIGGSVTVTDLDGGTGGSDDGMWDTEVLGNVTFNHGPGAFTTDFDGYRTQLPVLIHGSLSVLGTGPNSVTVGFNWRNTGLVVGKKFTVTSGGGTAETLGFSKIEVGGDTSIKLGDGGNTITIDDSLFGGKFTLISGAGADTFNVETTAGTTSATEFKKAALIDLGAGSDFANIVFNGSNGGSIDSREYVVIWSTFKIKNREIQRDQFDREIFPNGGFIQ